MHSPGGSTFLYEMTSWPPSWKYDMISKIQLRQSMRIYWKNNPAKFLPSPIWRLKVKRLQLFWTSQLRATRRHLPYGITWHKWTRPAQPQPDRLVLNLLPRRDRRLSWPRTEWRGWRGWPNNKNNKMNSDMRSVPEVKKMPNHNVKKVTANRISTSSIFCGSSYELRESKMHELT